MLRWIFPKIAISEMEKENDLSVIKRKLRIIKKSGFGEIRILVKNGIVYRILSTEDEIVEQKKK